MESVNRKQMETPPQISRDPLPPDLHAAQDGAIFLAQVAGEICQLLRSEHSNDNIKGLVTHLIEQAREKQSACFAAIEAVGPELRATRYGPAIFGNIKAASVHEAAIAFDHEVANAVRTGAAPSECLSTRRKSADRMNANAIIENYANLQKHFHQLPDTWPDHKDIIVGIQIEAAWAADRRGHGERDYTRVGSPQVALNMRQKQIIGQSLTRRDQRRILDNIDKMRSARKKGHQLLLDYADCIQKMRKTLRMDAGNLDLKLFAEIGERLKEAVTDLEIDSRLIRPFRIPPEWKLFGEYVMISDGQRCAFEAGSTWKPTDDDTWLREVIKPMKDYHFAIMAAMNEFRTLLVALPRKGSPGRPSRCPKSVAYGVRERSKMPATPWKDIYTECQRRCTDMQSWKNEELPNLREAFVAAVRRALNKGLPK